MNNRILSLCLGLLVGSATLLTGCASGSSDSTPSNSPATVASAGSLNSVISLTPANSSLAYGTNATFSATGGTPPYYFSVAPVGTSASGATIDSANGLFHAPNADGNFQVTVRDSAFPPHSAIASVQVLASAVNPPPSTLVNSCNVSSSTGILATQLFCQDDETVAAANSVCEHEASTVQTLTHGTQANCPSYEGVAANVICCKSRTAGAYSRAASADSVNTVQVYCAAGETPTDRTATCNNNGTSFSPAVNVVTTPDGRKGFSAACGSDIPVGMTVVCTGNAQ